MPPPCNTENCCTLESPTPEPPPHTLEPHPETPEPPSTPDISPQRRKRATSPRVVAGRRYPPVYRRPRSPSPKNPDTPANPSAPKVDLDNHEDEPKTTEPIPADPDDPIIALGSACSRHRLEAQAPNQPLLVVTVPVNGIPCRLLIDSGASRNFLSKSWVTQHRIRSGNIPRALRIRLADGTLTATAQHASGTVDFPALAYDSDFLVLKLPEYDGILGMPFLAATNPDIDWTSNSITAPFRLEGERHQAPEVRCMLLEPADMRKLLKKDLGTELYLCMVSELEAELENTTPDPMAPKTDMSSDNEGRLHQLLRKFKVTFDEPSGVTDAGPDMRINLKPGTRPPDQPLRRMSPAELEEVKRQLESYLAKGWIRPSVSEFGAPVLFARKADGSLRFCVDYRELNSATIKDRYPLPRPDMLFDQLHGAKCFSTVDLWTGYHQSRIHPDDIHKTSFKTRFGSFEFLVLPFGLTNAPSQFMRLMQDVLKPYLDKFVVIFLDDVLIYSKNEEEHLRHIELVLQAFEKAKLRVKLSKCSFARKSTRFLGYIVSGEGLSVDPKKTSAVADWPLPHDHTSTRSFLGFVGFFRRFIKDFAKIAAPLTDLTKSTVPFPDKLPQAAVDAFHLLKAALVAAPLLIVPFTGPEATFELYTDASGVGLGAVLLQDQGKGPQPVCYESRKLSPAEQNYPVHEQELLGVVYAVKMFRHYLEGCKSFTIYTDHHSLRYFFTQKDLSRRQARWAQELANFQPNMTIVYKKGADNQADALSRLPSLNSLDDRSDAGSAARVEGLVESLIRLLPVHILADAADELKAEIQASYVGDPFFESERETKMLEFRDGLWYYPSSLEDNREIIVVGSACSGLRGKLIAQVHDEPTAGHADYRKTLATIKRQYWWKGMNKTVKSYVRSCVTCQRIKSSTQAPAGLLQPHQVPPRPWAHVSMDLITDLPPSKAYDGQVYDSVVTFVDMLTKEAIFVRARKSMDAEQLARIYVDHVFAKKGLSQKLVSDRDTRINSEFWKTVFASLNTTLNMSTAFHPETDGQTERTHRTIEQILRALVNPHHDDWADWLPVAEFAYNNHDHSSTGFSPFYATKGYHPDTPASLVFPSSPSLSPGTMVFLEHLWDIHDCIRLELDLVKKRQAEYANRSRREVELQVGDRVMLSSQDIALALHPSSKFRPRWLGPFTIKAQISPVSFKLELPSAIQAHPVFHVSRLKPFIASDDHAFPGRSHPEQALPPLQDFVTDGIPVVSITDVRVQVDPDSRARPRSHCLFFEVQWAAPEPSSWEPMRQVRRTDAFRTFLASPRWAAFTSSPEYATFARKYKSKLPKPAVSFV